MDTTAAPWFVYDRSIDPGFLYIMHLHAFVFLEGFGFDFVSSRLRVKCTLVFLKGVREIVEVGGRLVNLSVGIVPSIYCFPVQREEVLLFQTRAAIRLTSTHQRHRS